MWIGRGWIFSPQRNETRDAIHAQLVLPAYALPGRASAVNPHFHTAYYSYCFLKYPERRGQS
jgi:hypothetical protein